MINEEQAGPESLVHDNADQEDQERGVDVQQTCPSGLIYNVERQVFHRLEFRRISEAMKSNHPFLT